MEREFQQHIEEKKLFNSEDRLLVALSGGVDSVVLCHLLKTLNYTFSIAHCNFQLRGEDSTMDEIFSKKLSRKLDTKFYRVRFDTKTFALQKKISIQMAARQLRYEWFHNLRAEHKYDYILTAHHLNDQVETILINLTRGTGLKGITGIPEKKLYMVRPLLIFTRKEIETYAKNSSLVFREDHSNSDEKYARNHIRKNVIPILKEINPSLEQTISSNIKNFKEAYLVSENYLQEKFKSLKLNFDYKENRLSIKELKKEKHLNFVLHGILSKFGFNASQIENAAELLDSISGKEIHSTDYFILKDRDYLIIKSKEIDEFRDILIETLPFNFENTSEEFFTFDMNALKWIEGSERSADNSETNETPKKINVSYFDGEKIKLPLKIRKWKHGDKFYPVGMQGSKKLSDYFVGIKASKIEKNSALILECGGEIMWVMGKTSDRRFTATRDTKKVLAFKVSAPN